MCFAQPGPLPDQSTRGTPSGQAPHGRLAPMGQGLRQLVAAGVAAGLARQARLVRGPWGCGPSQPVGRLPAWEGTGPRPTTGGAAWPRECPRPAAVQEGAQVLEPGQEDIVTAFQEASKSQPTGHFDVVQVAEEYLVWEAYEAAHTTNHREKACHDIPTALCVATSQSKPSRCNAPTSNRGGFIDRVSRRAGTVHRGGAAGTREGAVDVVAGYRGWPSWLGTAGAGTVAAVTREG